MIMETAKHYVKYSTNECINNLKKRLFICEGAIYIYEMGRLKRPGRLGRWERTFLGRLPKRPDQILTHVFRQSFFI